ncbi:hypothetical protein PAL_GLEAN10022910 [Pteropus alecto]|uniref:Uncharacterized protein n=1 Tax=Pteropus alecto TaxID=9402 RepID=L5K719_PTEAL|nr:hypothetical protein PAL_GLEAN10022910 [Pteropus alecto]
MGQPVQQSPLPEDERLQAGSGIRTPRGRSRNAVLAGACCVAWPPGPEPTNQISRFSPVPSLNPPPPPWARVPGLRHGQLVKTALTPGIRLGH